MRATPHLVLTPPAAGPTAASSRATCARCRGDGRAWQPRLLWAVIAMSKRSAKPDTRQAVRETCRLFLEAYDAQALTNPRADKIRSSRPLIEGIAHGHRILNNSTTDDENMEKFDLRIAVACKFSLIAM